MPQNKDNKAADRQLTPETEKSIQMFFNSSVVKTVVGVGTAFSVVLGMYNLINTIDDRFKQMVTDSSIIITKEIQRVRYELAEMHYDDLSVRLIMINIKIKALSNNGQIVPERLTIEAETLRDQKSAVEKKWLKKQ